MTPNDMPPVKPKHTWKPPQDAAKDYCAPAQPLPHHHPHHNAKSRRATRNGYHPQDDQADDQD